MKRLRDEVVDVRLSALTRLIEVGTENPDNLTVATFKEIGKRVSDRKLEVRKLAVVGLSRMYWKHVSSMLPPLPSYCDKLNNKSMRERDGDKDRDPSTSPSLYMFENSLKKGILEKLGFVPGFVVNTWGYVEMRPLIMQLLQENVLPKYVRLLMYSLTQLSPRNYAHTHIHTHIHTHTHTHIHTFTHTHTHTHTHNALHS